MSFERADPKFDLTASLRYCMAARYYRAASSNSTTGHISLCNPVVAVRGLSGSLALRLALVLGT
jgi:hypothetical protein